MPEKQNNSNAGCGCSRIPISLVLIILGFGYWWLFQRGNIKYITSFFSFDRQVTISKSTAAPTVNSPSPKSTDIPQNTTKKLETNTQSKSTPKQTITPTPKSTTKSTTKPLETSPKQAKASLTPWEKKTIRGIYLSRYQITNNADEATIRQRVRYYKDRGINTIIHGVWGNGCTMYKSAALQKMLGIESCPNQFQDRWLDWLIDEAHKQGMEVHAYFEKGIKIDENSPIFDLAVSKKWIVAGVDRTYAGVEHYVLDVEIPEVASLFKNILVEFVQKYPKIDAVQWDDYLGYHAELPGKVDRTDRLTEFLQQTIVAMKKANPSVSFDICHHNPYWAKQYFAADWEKWKIDRAFIQAYNEKNFKEELNYAKQYAGIAITDNQFGRLKELISDPEIKSILIFPLSGKPEEVAENLQKFIQTNNDSEKAK